MKNALVFCLIAAVSFDTSVRAAKQYPCRWFYMSSGLGSEADVAYVAEKVRTAAGAGLNGMVFSGGLDRLSMQNEQYLQRLDRIKAVCAENKMELIPLIFSVGYGGSVLAHDRELAAGIPVEDALFIARSGRAVFAQDPPVEFVNGGLESHNGLRVTGFNFHDKPGEVSFVDTNVFKEGAASLRFEHFGNFEHGYGRIMQEIRVRPHRLYRVSCWVKTEGLNPEGCFRFTILTKDGRYIAPFDPRVPATTDWRKVTVGFNSLQYDTVRIYAGCWGGRQGRFWVDDFRIEEIGMVNLLRRPGTPITIRSERTGQILRPGIDYIEPVDAKRNWRFDHDGPSIELLADGAVKEGDRLRASFYHGIAINRGQVSVCMSEPRLYEIWTREARLLYERLQPEKYLLSMDEIRAGGTCRACKERGLSMAEILGDCITRQCDILRSNNPRAEVLIWSDMLDPNHNAHGDYYLVEGDFSGSWRYVPKDLIIVCWHHGKRRESLAHFSSLGFRTLAGAYYDGDTLENPRDWLHALDGTKGAIGIMYTTWQNKYELLEPFGRLVIER